MKLSQNRIKVIGSFWLEVKYDNSKLDFFPGENIYWKERKIGDLQKI